MKAAIEALPAVQVVQLREWLREREWSQRDEQIAADSAAGKLDFLIEKSQQAKDDGTLEEL